MEENKRRADERQMHATLEWKKGARGERQHMWASGVQMEGEEPLAAPLRFLPVCEAGRVGRGGNLTLRTLIEDPHLQRHTNRHYRHKYALSGEGLH